MAHRKEPDTDQTSADQGSTGQAAADPPAREQRSYPHGSGDRNAWSPTRKDPMPRHEGGTQRRAPTDSVPGSETPE